MRPTVPLPFFGHLQPRVEVVGVYPVEAEELCHLIELIVHESKGPFDTGLFCQEDPNLERADWQVAYDEKVLDWAGTGILADGFDLTPDSEIWSGDVRLCFFLHYVDLSKPLETPFGAVELPEPTPRPARLDQVEYWPPD